MSSSELRALILAVAAFVAGGDLQNIFLQCFESPKKHNLADGFGALTRQPKEPSDMD